MCLTKTKTNWECGMGNELNCRQISTQLGLELEVGIVYMFPECVKEIFLVHIPLSHSTRNCILKNESLWFCLPTLFIYCRHSWEMSVDYKFTEGLMRVCFSGFLLPLQRTASTSWKCRVVGRGRSEVTEAPGGPCRGKGIQGYVSWARSLARI